MCFAFDLTDIWRIRNPDVKRFSWKQKNPAIQRLLDYWLIIDNIQEEIEKVDIIPTFSNNDNNALFI